MTDAPVPPFQISSIIIDRWKLRNPSALLLIPAEFPAEIGKVTFAWSFFETAFEGGLEAFTAAHAIPEDKWRGWSFRRRRTLFRELLGKTFGDCPNVLAYGEEIATASEPLYLKRNLVVHGRLQFEFVSGPDGQLVKLACSGRQNRRLVRESFTKDELDDLFYEIAHLMGRLNCLLTGDIGLPPTSPETPKLRAFLETNHPLGPLQRMHAPPPQS
jgi:hypothetical protein